MGFVRVGALAGSLLFVCSLANAKNGLLPLKRVRFYETGVAYFERSGAVGEEAVTLPVPASHLDDALKTLVVYANDGAARLGGVEFASSVSRGMAKALAGIGPGHERLGLLTLLESLKGASVALALAEGSILGRLVEVLDEQTSDLKVCVPSPKDPESRACEPRAEASLVLMTKTHELRRVALRDVRGVRPLDAALASRIGAALDALSGGSARVLKELRVLARGQTVSLGYISEAPVWRASYRLVLGEGNDAALQGWALLHNDTDENWSGIGAELVNGLPDSFLFPLAAPRYAERQLVTPEHELSTVPQLMRSTPDAMWAADEEGGGGYGEGIGLGSIGSIGHGAGHGSYAVRSGSTTVSAEASSLLTVGNLAGVAASEGVESGALFRYALGGKLDLRAHGSALVPFLGETVIARRVALFATARGGARSDARSAVYLTHAGNQTLPPGTIAVFSDGGFAGESALPRLKPSETTTIEYGSDLDVTLDETRALTLDEPRALRFEQWNLVEHYVRHHRLSEHLENRSGGKREAFVALPYVNNAKVQGADELVYDSRNARAFAVFALAPRTTLDRTLEVEEGLTRRHPVSELTAAKLALLGAATTVPAEQRTVVREAGVLLAKAEAKRRALAAARAELRVRDAEVARFREHARALGSARGTEDVVARLLEAEDRAEANRRSIRALAAEADALARRATRTLTRLGD
jgi:hypothetical protein